MKFFKTFFTISFFIFSTLAKSQWNYHCNFDTSLPPGMMSPVGNFSGADFISKDTGVYGYSYTISPSSGGASVLKKTFDGGNTWSGALGGGTGSSMGIYSIRKQKTFYITNNVYGGPNGVSTTLIKSAGMGTSWNTIYNRGYSLVSNITGVDTSHYYFTRFQLPSPISFYLGKYTNGVLNDSYLNITSMNPGTLFFPDTAIGFMSSGNKRILKTIDGGASWDTVYYDSLRTIGNMYFVDTNVGYVICDSGKMIKTFDGGISWQNINTGSAIKLNSLFFLNANTGFVAGDSGRIARTYDGGNSWTQDITGTTASFQKIFFVNDSIGYAIVNHSMYQTNRLSSGVWTTVKETEELIIYPNPTHGEIHIELPPICQNNKNTTLTVYDSYGKMVSRFFAVDKAIELDISAQAKGLYLIYVSDGKRIFHNRIVFE